MSTLSRQSATCLFAFLLLSTAGVVHAEGFGLGVRAGTTGLGLEGTWGLSEHLNLRLGYYAFDYGTDLNEEGIEYDGDLRLRNAALFVDWHPFRHGFRVSAGAVQSGNDFRGSADGELEVGEDTYVGEVEAKVSWSGTAPYVGIGFGNAVRGSRWSFALDLGVMFTGSPSVRLDGTVDDPALEDAFREDLDRERAELRDELSDARYFPVVSLGLSYRF
jgi:hypothetical protein